MKKIKTVTKVNWRNSLFKEKKKIKTKTERSQTLH